jgi:DNA-binding GntR family transcriptional regulator
MRTRPDEKQPRYRQVAEALLADVRAGRIRVGETLPGELELVGRYGVSRHTVREALRVLGELGLIERRQGVGTVLRSRDSSEAYVQTIRSPEELMRYPPQSRLEVVATQEVRASRKLAATIGCPVGSRWMQISCLRRMAPLPGTAKAGRARAICWVDIYVLPEYAGVARLIGRRNEPVYELIEQKFGEKVARVTVDLRARTLDPGLATALDVAPGSPSLTVVRRYWGRSRRVFEVSVSEHPAERYTYSLELRRGWQAGDTSTMA